MSAILRSPSVIDGDGNSIAGPYLHDMILTTGADLTTGWKLYTIVAPRTGVMRRFFFRKVSGAGATFDLELHSKKLTSGAPTDAANLVNRIFNLVAAAGPSDNVGIGRWYNNNEYAEPHSNNELYLYAKANAAADSKLEIRVLLEAMA